MYNETQLKSELGAANTSVAFFASCMRYPQGLHGNRGNRGQYKSDERHLTTNLADDD